MRRLTLAALLLTALLLAAATLTAQTPTSHPYTQLYVFGDSYSDTGAGYVFADGPTAVGYLADRLKIPFTYFGDPKSKGKSINFAVSAAKTGSGSGTRNANGSIFALGMKNQVDEFSALLALKQIKFNPADTMFFLAGGLNDRGTPEGYTRTNLESEIDTLYALGARRFMVALLPVKIPEFDTAGLRLNADLARIPADEHARHPDIRIANSDWGSFFDQVITHPTQYGITDTTTYCAGRNPKDNAPDPCLSPQTHFYYFGGHPSTAAHKAVGDMLYTEAITKAP